MAEAYESSGMPAGAGHESGLLRALTCGSDQAGKSSLIRRLLAEGRAITFGRMPTQEQESRSSKMGGESLALAKPADPPVPDFGQVSSSDVTIHHLAKAKHCLSIVDPPGRKQHAGDVAVGASHCDLAILVVDAGRGLCEQVRLHAQICSLFGIRSLVLAVTKMDLVAFSEAAFDRIVDDYTRFAAKLGFTRVQPIPVSARTGDNVAAPSRSMPWYPGPTLLGHLEGIVAANTSTELPLRFSVQQITETKGGLIGYAGTILSGTVRPGEKIVAARSGQARSLARIVTVDGELVEARAGDAVTLVLDDVIDLLQGDILASPRQPPTLTDQFAAHILWTGEDPLLPGRQYMLRIGHASIPASVTAIKHRVDVGSLEQAAARTLSLDEIGFCNLSLSRRVVLDPFAQNPATGRFTLVDHLTNKVLGFGIVAFSLYRAENVRVEHFPVDKAARARLNGQRPFALWFTGLSGSGKSTIAKLVEQSLHHQGKRTFSLDGDNLRHGLNRDLGFSDADRVENIRRIGEVAKLFTEAGLIVICSAISPFLAERRMLRGLLSEGEYLEIFVDTPIEECMRRDPKGLYAKAKNGEIRNFTGIDSPYERPEAPDLRIETLGCSPEDSADQVLDWLARRK